MINRYYLICLVGIITGILLSAYNYKILAISVTILFVVLFFLKKRNVFLIAIIFLLLGAILTTLGLKLENTALYSYANKGKISGTMQITDITYVGSGYTYCTAEILNIGDAKCNESIKLGMYTNKEIIYNGLYSFKDLSVSIADKKELYSYGSDKIFYEGYVHFSNISYIETPNNGVKNKIRNLREGLNTYIIKKFDKTTASVICALFTGETRFISKDIKNLFNNTGIRHILAVSGLHIAMILMVLSFIFDRFGRFKYIKYLFIIFFAVFTGGSPSIVRAVCMCLFLGLGDILKRSSDSVNILSSIALANLLINPLLLFNISFQLSYLATYGIIALTPVIYQPGKFKVFNFIESVTTATICAQIMTLPVIVSMGQGVTLVSITMNLVVSVLLPYIYLVTFIALMLPFDFFADIVNGGVNLILSACEFFEESTSMQIKIANTNSALQIMIPILILITLYTINYKSRSARQRIKNADTGHKKM